MTSGTNEGPGPGDRIRDDAVIPDDDTVIPNHRRPDAADVPEDDEEPGERGFYRFRVGDGGDVLVLDRASYVGRSPSPPRIPTESEPRLIAVDSPRREVSSTHIELRQVGARVVVTDMKSTNGTFVTIPGGAPRKLRQGESLVVTPGTIVDIGDGILIEVLPMRLTA